MVSNRTKSEYIPSKPGSPTGDDHKLADLKVDPGMPSPPHPNQKRTNLIQKYDPIVRPSSEDISNLVQHSRPSQISNSVMQPNDFGVEPIKFAGLLCKWTNYATGYKKRYFVLEDGTLRYYKNIFEYPMNCRGSLTILNCLLYLNSEDPLRFDIVSPGEGHRSSRKLGKIRSKRNLENKGLPKDLRDHGGFRYHLKAESIEDLNKWVTSFHKARNYENYKIIEARKRHEFGLDDNYNRVGLYSDLEDNEYSSGEGDDGLLTKKTYQEIKSIEDMENEVSSEESDAYQQNDSVSLTEFHKHGSFIKELEAMIKMIDKIRRNLNLYSGTSSSSAGSGDIINGKKGTPPNRRRHKSLFLKKRVVSKSKQEAQGEPNLVEGNTKTIPISALSSQLFALSEYLENVIRTREISFINKLASQNRKISRLEDRLRGAIVTNSRIERTLLEERVVRDNLLERLEQYSTVLLTAKSSDDKAILEAEESFRHLLRDFNALTVSPEEEEEFFDAKDDLEDEGTIKYLPIETPLGKNLKRNSSLTLVAAIQEADNNEPLLADKSSVGENTPKALARSLPAAQEYLMAVTECGYPIHSRESLPIPMVVDASSVSVWTVLKNAIGKDLTRVSIPIHYNEPLSMLQRMTEDMEYYALLEKACMEKDSLIRLAYISAFAVSGYSSSNNRISKPFNPLLHETFELIESGHNLPYGSGGGGFTYIAEQVSHHPPISACYCESNNLSDNTGWIYWSNVNVKTAFWGKSVELSPLGISHLVIKETGEHYSFRRAHTSINNVVIGKLWIDHYGSMTIVNHKTNETCNLEFVKTGWRTSPKDGKRISGSIFDANKNLIYMLEGKWNEGLTATKAIGDIPVSPRYDALPFLLDIWQVYARSALSSQMYNFTHFAMKLNENPPSLQKFICPTDARNRPDQRAMENGNLEAGVQWKDSLEQWQRLRRKRAVKSEILKDSLSNSISPTQSMDIGGDGIGPRWFSRELEDDTGEPHWVYTGGYWEQRATSNWASAPLIYQAPPSF